MTSSRFRVFRLLFLLTGDPVLGEINSRWYWLYSACMILCAVLTSLGMTLDVVVNLRDLNRFTQNARLLLTMFICFCYHTLRLRTRQLQDLLILAEDFTWDDLPAVGMASYIPMIRKLTWRSVIAVLCSHGVQLISRFSTEDERPLMFNSWFPFNTSQSPAFELLYVVHAVASAWFTISANASIGLYATLVAIACTQLQKLRRAFLQPGLDLRACVYTHQGIKAYLKSLQGIYGLVLIGPFLLISLGMCIATFSILLGDAMDALQALIIMASLTAQLYMFCWFGNELTQETASLREAVWGSDWVGADLHKQKALVFVLAASDQFTLTAGALIPVSRHSLMQVLNQT